MGQYVMCAILVQEPTGDDMHALEPIAWSRRSRQVARRAVGNAARVSASLLASSAGDDHLANAVGDGCLLDQHLSCLHAAYLNTSWTGEGSCSDLSLLWHAWLGAETEWLCGRYPLGVLVSCTAVVLFL